MMHVAKPAEVFPPDHEKSMKKFLTDICIPSRNVRLYHIRSIWREKERKNCVRTFFERCFLTWSNVGSWPFVGWRSSRTPTAAMSAAGWTSGVFNPHATAADSSPIEMSDSILCIPRVFKLHKCETRRAASNPHVAKWSEVSKLLLNFVLVRTETQIADVNPSHLEHCTQQRHKNKNDRKKGVRVVFSSLADQ